MSILFANIGWMTAYAGYSADDPTLGNFGYLKDNDLGHEAWNFFNTDGRVFGYVPHSGKINLENLGAVPRDQAIDGVTVVWIARSPSNGKTYIIGWYKNATVFRKPGQFELRRQGRWKVEYQITAAHDEATLLPVDARVFSIPTAKQKGNLGQNPIWYGGTDDFRARVTRYVTAGGKFKGKINSAPKQNDPELRRKIEKAAIDHAIAYYSSPEGGGRVVKSVETEAKGWDLEATAIDDDVLKIEVKGLTGAEVNFELTPNEFEKMRQPAHRSSYVLYVLTEALQETAQSHIFRYHADLSSRAERVWIAEDGRRLKIVPRTGARVFL